jgi:hypothetical protein
MLGDARSMMFDDAWRCQPRDRVAVVNEDTLRKLMRGQRVFAQRQYWLVFDDADAMCARLAGRPGDGAPTHRVEERQQDRFALTMDCYAGMVRAQTATQALVVVALRDKAMLGCLFDVRF